ncbi:MAG TPA: efflux RND transporter periplasmic adaptor subunit, partial [Planctomycetota bacterium]|nr:efflux RND transporter periplasmic adaptor subunit [Planctomycetota bacterium]
MTPDHPEPLATTPALPPAVTASDAGLRLQASARPRTGTVVVVLVIGALALGGLLAVGLRPLLHREQALAASAEQVRSAPVRVTVITAQPGATTNDLVLPGECAADQASDLFARTNGYVQHWNVDLGDRVSTGQVLCTIESPEVDEELSRADAVLIQTRAQVGTAQATSKLAAISLKRFAELREGKTISEQSYTERVAADEMARAALDVAQAEVLVAEANQRRLSKLKSFESVSAPFDGTITARNAEVGSLVSSGSVTGAKPLFRIARTDVLRVFVDVPQNVAHEVQVGQVVRVIARERPGAIDGTVSRTAGVIDPTSRTLRVEVRVQN